MTYLMQVRMERRIVAHGHYKLVNNNSPLQLDQEAFYLPPYFKPSLFSTVLN